MALFLVLDFGDAQGFSSLRFFDLERLGRRLPDQLLGDRDRGAPAVRRRRSRSRPPPPVAAPAPGFWFKASGVAVRVLRRLEEFLGVHSWANQHGVSWNVSYLPFVAVATLVWVELARHLESRPGARACACSASAPFSAACLFDAARAGERPRLRHRRAARDGRRPRCSWSRCVHAHAYRPGARRWSPAAAAIWRCWPSVRHRLDPVKLAIGAAVAVFVLGVMGAVSHSVRLHARVRREQGAELRLGLLRARAVGRGADGDLQRRRPPGEPARRGAGGSRSLACSSTWASTR